MPSPSEQEQLSIVGNGGTVQLVPGVVYTAPPLLDVDTSMTTSHSQQPYSNGEKTIFWLQGENGGVSKLKVVDSRSGS